MKKRNRVSKKGLGEREKSGEWLDSYVGDGRRRKIARDEQSEKEWWKIKAD